MTAASQSHPVDPSTASGQQAAAADADRTSEAAGAPLSARGPDTSSETATATEGHGDVVAASALYKDPRFTFGLVYEVAKVIERHGYEGVLCGHAMVELQGHLFAFLHGTDEGRDGRCFGKALSQALQREAQQ